MTTLCNSGIAAPLWRAQASVQAWAFERLIGADFAFGDVRSALVAVLSHLLTAAWNSLFENIAGRAFRGARFAQRLTAADTMLAAGDAKPTHLASDLRKIGRSA